MMHQKKASANSEYIYITLFLFIFLKPGMPAVRLQRLVVRKLRKVTSLAESRQLGNCVPTPGTSRELVPLLINMWQMVPNNSDAALTNSYAELVG